MLSAPYEDVTVLSSGFSRQDVNRFVHSTRILRIVGYCGKEETGSMFGRGIVQTSFPRGYLPVHVIKLIKAFYS